MAISSGVSFLRGRVPQKQGLKHGRMYFNDVDVSESSRASSTKTRIETYDKSKSVAVIGFEGEFHKNKD